MDATILLWLFFWIAMLVVIGYGFSLIYHWVRWGYMYPLVWVAMPVYIVGTLILIGGVLAGIGSI